MPARAPSLADSDEDREALMGDSRELAELSDQSQEGLSEDIENPWADHETAWRFVHTAKPEDLVFFENLSIARDGGLMEVTGTKDPESDNLWYSTRYVSALVLVSFVIMNVYYVFKQDIEAIFKEELAEVMTEADRAIVCGTRGSGGVCSQNYLLTNGILRGANYLAGRFCNTTFHITPTQIICSVEMIILCILLLEVFFRVLQVMCSKCLACLAGCCSGAEPTVRRLERLRWFAASQLFWDLIPQVAIFSGMKLLFFITPQVLTLHLNTILFYDEGRKLPALLWFVFSRAVACIIGFDSFLVKYRTANSDIMTQCLTLDHILAAVVLLNQIVGVVQVNWVIRDRLFRFVFGGEDGIMNNEEKVRMDTWNAMVTHRIWKSYDSVFDRLALLLTFCDDDFQRLCLSEGFEQKAQTKLHQSSVV